MKNHNCSHIQLLFLLIFILFQTVVYAQPDVRPGYIITNDFDTIQGFLDYRGAKRNSNVCTFKATESAPKETFTPNDLIGYRFTDSKFYVSKNLKIEGTEKKVFLEYLLNGIVDLYFYRGGDKDLYYIQKSDGELYELRNDLSTKIIEGVEYGLRSNQYVATLASLFSDCKEIQPEIKNTAFNYKSLTKVTRDYHNMVCNDYECIVYEKKIKNEIKFIPVANLRISTIRLGNPYNDIGFELSLYPTVGGMILFELNEISEKLSLDAGLSVGKRHFYSFYRKEYYLYSEIYRTNLYTTFLEISTDLKYTLSRGNIRPFIQTGFVFQPYLTNNSVRKISTIYGTVESPGSEVRNEFWLMVKNVGGFQGGIGLDIYFKQKKSCFIDLKYAYLPTLGGGQEHFVQSINLGTGWYF